MFFWKLLSMILALLAKVPKKYRNYELADPVPADSLKEIYRLRYAGPFNANGHPTPPYYHYVGSFPDRLPIWLALGYQIDGDTRVPTAAGVNAQIVLRRAWVE